MIDLRQIKHHQRRRLRQAFILRLALTVVFLTAACFFWTIRFFATAIACVVLLAYFWALYSPFCCGSLADDVAVANPFMIGGIMMLTFVQMPIIDTVPLMSPEVWLFAAVLLLCTIVLCNFHHCSARVRNVVALYACLLLVCAYVPILALWNQDVVVGWTAFPEDTVPRAPSWDTFYVATAHVPFNCWWPRAINQDEQGVVVIAPWTHVYAKWPTFNASPPRNVRLAFECGGHFNVSTTTLTYEVAPLDVEQPVTVLGSSDAANDQTYLVEEFVFLAWVVATLTALLTVTIRSARQAVREHRDAQQVQEAHDV